MNEVEFRSWMNNKGKNNKVISDCISRLKRIEKELNHCDIDNEYRSDRCEKILSIFLNMGNNNEMKMYSYAKFPIGKYYMSTYRYAIKQYVEFCDSITPNYL